MLLLLNLCALAAGARLRSEDGEETVLPTVTRLLQAKGDPLAMPKESLLVAKADGFQVPAPMVGAAALARGPPPRMADAPAKKTPKKVKKSNPSPFGDQPEVADPAYSIFEKPKDFADVEQWDKYAGGAAISPSRNFEGPSWERAYAEWEKKGIPRPSERQKLGTMPNFQQASNKAAREYDARRPDYSDGPMYRGKPKVTENYKKLDVAKYKNLPPPEPWQSVPNKMGYP